MWLIPPFLCRRAKLASVVEPLASRAELQGAGLMLLRCVVDAMGARSAHRHPPPHCVQWPCQAPCQQLSKSRRGADAIPKIASK